MIDASLAEGSPLRVVRLQNFEPAEPLSDCTRDAYLRRFATLFLDEETMRRGGVGEVVRAVSPRGERVALKRLNFDTVGDDARCALQAAFDEEYEVHRRLSNLKGFPRLFGRALIDETPCLVMEWIEGVTLREAARNLAVDDEGRLSPLTAARIGRDLFRTLEPLAYVGEGAAHRDVSLGNVMVDTSRQSLAAQVDEGAFTLRLVDFGSAVAWQEGSSSLTARFGGARGATADFAPPEMLTEDVGALERLRHSAAVDVYAASSVLYALIAGHPPYDLSFAAGERRGCRSAYRVKTEFAPEPLAGAHGEAADLGAVLAREPEVAVAVGHGAAEAGTLPSPGRLRLALTQVDDQLNELVMAGLSPAQKKRPCARAMADALSVFCDQYAANIERALQGEPLLPCTLRDEAARAFRKQARLKRVARGLVRAAVAAVCVAVAGTTALLAQGVPVQFPAGAGAFEGPLPFWVLLIALLVPGAAALAARGREGASTYGLVRGVLGDLLGAALVGALIAMAAWPPGAASALYGALFLAATVPLCGLVADSLFAVPGRRARNAAEKEVRRPVLPWGVTTVRFLGDAPATALLESPDMVYELQEEGL